MKRALRQLLCLSLLITVKNDVCSSVGSIVEYGTADLIQAARESFVRGVALSKQGAYARRAPDPNSVPHFNHARDLLTDVLRQRPDNRNALAMMSQVYESLLDFDAAIAFLDRAFVAGEPKTRKSLKRLALLRESAIAWRDLLLSPQALRDLGNFLETNEVGVNHVTMQLTREWLAANEDADPDKVIAALGRRGAFSDFQVLANVVYG